MSLFRQMQAEMLAIRDAERNANRESDRMAEEKKAKRVAKPVTMYLVGAWNMNHGYWKVFRETNLHEFESEFDAEQFAAKLSRIVWSDVQIIKLRFPGAGQQKNGE